LADSSQRKCLDPNCNNDINHLTDFLIGAASNFILENNNLLDANINSQNTAIIYLNFVMMVNQNMLYDIPTYYFVWKTI